MSRSSDAKSSADDNPLTGPLFKLIIALKLFPPASPLINKRVQNHVWPHKLITTSDSTSSELEKNKRRKPGEARCVKWNEREAYGMHSWYYRPLPSFPPSNELWESKLMNACTLNNRTAVISHLSCAAVGRCRVISGLASITDIRHNFSPEGVN